MKDANAFAVWKTIGLDLYRSHNVESSRTNGSTVGFYDGSSYKLGNVFIDYKNSDKTISVGKSNVEKRTKKNSSITQWIRQNVVNVRIVYDLTNIIGRQLAQKIIETSLSFIGPNTGLQFIEPITCIGSIRVKYPLCDRLNSYQFDSLVVGSMTSYRSFARPDIRVFKTRSFISHVYPDIVVHTMISTLFH